MQFLYSLDIFYNFFDFTLAFLLESSIITGKESRVNRLEIFG